MGRKKKPTNTKVIQGTFRKDRANPNEPAYKTEIPPAPDHLSKEALIEWGRVSNELHNQGLLSAVDMAALAGYCQSYGRWVDAETQLNAEGLTVETTNGNKIQNPLVGIANQAKEHMRKFLIEFGMTPASRAKVSARKKKKDDEWAKFG